MGKSASSASLPIIQNGEENREEQGFVIKTNLSSLGNQTESTLTTNWPNSSFVENALEILLDTKLNRSPCNKESQQHPELCYKECSQQADGDVIPALS